MEKNYSCLLFHVGRGGLFNNPGFTSFVCVDTFKNFVAEYYGSKIVNTDAFGKPLPDDEWTVTDEGGNVLLSGRDEIEADEGILDRDGKYDMDIVRRVDHLSGEELDLVAKAIMMSDREINYLTEDDVLYIGEESPWVDETFFGSTVTWNGDPQTVDDGKTLGAVLLDFWQNRGSLIDCYTFDDYEQEPHDWYCYRNLLDNDDEDDLNDWNTMLQRLNVDSAKRIFITKTMTLCLQEDMNEE